MRVPNLATVQPLLIGPITDTLTICSDLLLAMQSKLVQPGQTAYVSRTIPNGGIHILLGLFSQEHTGRSIILIDV